ncbi:putative hydro-lyase [Roseibium polysiphoniae]|uniref:putative hydro-lyase n=1 Tax=Roseibium polysiphoniae TaxID=2571221 RepID=UPI003297829F
MTLYAVSFSLFQSEGVRMVQTVNYSELVERDFAAVRSAIRSGLYTGHTAGLAKGHLQCNLAIVSGDLADDFHEFCRLNPKSCPLAGVSEPGNPQVERLGETVDIRTDAARYNIYRRGVLAEQVPDLIDVWQRDFVAFAIGCSFTFENALLRAGISMRHIEMDVTVPMYRSSIKTVPCGPFGGDTVVSMRPIREDRIDEVFEICRSYPLAHGAPLQIGAPEEIGVADVGKPDWGNAVDIGEGEVPLFWACGVTPQVAIMQAKSALSITHAPGAMLIAEVSEQCAPIYPYNDNKKSTF